MSTGWGSLSFLPSHELFEWREVESRNLNLSVVNHEKLFFR